MKRETGFTLIEVMIVVAIIGIMAAFAVWSVNDLNEAKRLRGTTHDVQMLLVKARAGAQAHSRLFKVCMYRDADRKDQIPEGRAIVMMCGSTGFGGCPTGLVCTDTTANASPFFSGTEVEGLCPANPTSGAVLPEVWTTDPLKWCVFGGSHRMGSFNGDPTVAEGLDIGGVGGTDDGTFNYGGAPTVSIDHFEDFGNWVDFAPVGNVLEITYSPSGAVSVGRSTPGRTSGRVSLSTFTQCDPGDSGGSFTCDRNTLRSFSYTAAGSFKTEQEREIPFP